jgi:hypothetical protein
MRDSLNGVNCKLNLKCLGHVLDRRKGSIFDFLREAQPIRGLALDPTASDFKPCTAEDFGAFANLLRITPARIIPHSLTLDHRPDYFPEVSSFGDLIS